MPISQINRRLAAVGTALALVMLPISGTLTSTPVLAQPSPSADAGSSAGAGAEGPGPEDATGGSDDDSDGAADGGNQPGADNSVEGGDNEKPTDFDGACRPLEEDEPPPPEDVPCEPAEELTAQWNPATKQLSLNPPHGNPGDMPRSWKGKVFNGPRQPLRVPAQNSSSADSAQTRTAEGTEPEGTTDDSGNPLPSPKADVPTRFFLNAKGQVVAEGQTEPMRFEFDGPPEPAWTFTSDGKRITVTGEEYAAPGGTADADGSSSASANSTTGSDGAKDGDPAAAKDSESSASSNSDGSTSGADADPNANSENSDTGDSNRNATSDASGSSDSSASPDANASANSSASADTGAEKRADSEASGQKDSTGASSGSDSDGSKDAKASSGSDGSNTGADEDEGHKNGTGTVTGDVRADPDDSTPDPATGNGGRDGRQTIPGSAGDEWLPGGEASQPPDYSDPVPRNPDSPTSEDDTDLITGGDTPSPRANQPPSTSFGESIVSTIVSSWPVFVLAASGMAAVGFIIYLMGRRGKQN